jgi:hypothetical protein
MTMNTEPGTGSFPTMGTSAAELKVVAKPERGRERTRGVAGMGGSSFPQQDKANRGRSTERMGASLHPGATLYEANAACASDTGHRVVQMPSRSSWTDNWRSAAKKLQSGVSY